MTSKERVLTALTHQQPDRVPINYSANAGIDRRLKRHFHLSVDDDEGLRQALDVDFCGVFPPYRGAQRHPPATAGVMVDEWGIHRRWVEHPTGGYWDFCDFPLRDADEETVARWPMPSPDDFDYSEIAETCRRLSRYAIYTGGPGIPDIINSTGMIRTMEQVLVDLAVDEPAGILYINRRAAIYYEVMARTLEAAKGGIDILWMGEDLGTQIGPMISLELFRRHIRPRHQRFIDLAKAFGAKVMMHSCGSSSWAFEDFIAMGVDGVETLQPEARDMEPARLKARYGSRLTLHGCISTAGPVATGTVAETVAICRQTLDIMMPGGGYIFAPTHALQDNSPTENVLAMYATARDYGTY